MCPETLLFLLLPTNSLLNKSHWHWHFWFSFTNLTIIKGERLKWKWQMNNIQHNNTMKATCLLINNNWKHKWQVISQWKTIHSGILVRWTCTSCVHSVSLQVKSIMYCDKFKAVRWWTKTGDRVHLVKVSGWIVFFHKKTSPFLSKYLLKNRLLTWASFACKNVCTWIKLFHKKLHFFFSKFKLSCISCMFI